MKLFWTLFAFDAGIAAVLGVVVLDGLCDGIAAGHIDREDLLLWPPLVAGMTCVLGGAWRLRSRGMLRGAIGVLLLMAVPGLVAVLGLLVLLVVLTRPGAWG